MLPIINMALRAARLGAEEIKHASERLDLIKAEGTHPLTFIDNLCVRVEKIVQSTLQKAYPHHTFQGAFSGHYDALSEGEKPCHWFISPTDNIVHLANAIPLFALSIIGYSQNKVEHVIIINPFTDEEFTSSRGQGTQLNGRRVRVSTAKQLQDVFLGTSHSQGKTSFDAFQQHQHVLALFKQQGCEWFTAESAFLNMAYMACGRLDAIMLESVPEEQVDAGCLLIQEAGGLIGDFAGSNKMLSRKEFVAANPKLFKSIIKTLHALK